MGPKLAQGDPQSGQLVLFGHDPGPAGDDLGPPPAQVLLQGGQERAASAACRVAGVV